MNVNTLNRRVATALISSVLFVGMSMQPTSSNHRSNRPPNSNRWRQPVSPSSLSRTSRRTPNIGIRGSLPSRGIHP